WQAGLRSACRGEGAGGPGVSVTNSRTSIRSRRQEDSRLAFTQAGPHRPHAAPGIPSVGAAKFDARAAMADLGRLVLRSGAPQLRLRIAVALALVLVGKIAAVGAPLMIGDAINRLAPGTGETVVQ